MSNLRNISVLLCSISIILQSPITVANHKASHGAATVKYQHLSKKTEKKHKQYKKEVQKAFVEYKSKTAKVWGKDTVVPSAEVNVTYYEDINQRSVVDFSKGKVKVELAIEQENIAHTAIIQRRLSNTLKKTILLGADTRSIVEIAKQLEAPADSLAPVLEGLIADKDGKPLRKQAITAFLFSTTKSYNLRTLKGTNGSRLVAVSAEFSLIEQHLLVRSKLYEVAVSRNSTQHLIPSPLIFAIMEIESSFNPMAKSPIPAFGLMQLVPTKGARDAFRFLHSKDEVVKDTYLYQPDNNIDLGVAYLHMLYFRYLKYIENPDAKKWAMVAAYNTGVTMC